MKKNSILDMSLCVVVSALAAPALADYPLQRSVWAEAALVQSVQASPNAANIVAAGPGTRHERRQDHRENRHDVRSDRHENRKDKRDCVGDGPGCRHEVRQDSRDDRNENRDDRRDDRRERRF